MGWSTSTFTDSYDWSLIGNIRQFWDALGETLNVANGTAVTPSLPSIGDDVSGAVGGTWHIDTLQNGFTGTIGAFLDPTFNFDGAPRLGGDTGTVPTPDYAVFHTDGGIGNRSIWDAMGLTNQGWTRKRPAEIADTSVTTEYADGMGWDSGDSHRAVNTNDIAYNAADHGLKYQFTSGAWTKCADQHTALPTLRTGFGGILPGDYIGPWIWQELHDLNNLLIWTTGIVDSGYEGTSVHTIGESDAGTPEKSLATAKSEATAGWAADTDTTHWYWGIGALGCTWTETTSGGAHTYSAAFVERGRAQLHAVDESGFISMTHSIDYYAASKAASAGVAEYPDSPSGGAGVIPPFDKLGDGVADEGHFRKLTGRNCVDDTAQPAWPSATISGSHPTFGRTGSEQFGGYGIDTNNAFAVIKWTGRTYQ